MHFLLVIENSRSRALFDPFIFAIYYYYFSFVGMMEAGVDLRNKELELEVVNSNRVGSNNGGGQTIEQGLEKSWKF